MRINFHRHSDVKVVSIHSVVVNYCKSHPLQWLELSLRVWRTIMAEEIGSAAGKVAGKAALKSFMSPSIDIIKTIPQGIIELVFRGAGAVSIAGSATSGQMTTALEEIL